MVNIYIVKNFSFFFWLKKESSRSDPVEQDEVDQARESCMEEECERVEAEIAKERVHNENRMLKVETTLQVSLL